MTTTAPETRTARPVQHAAPASGTRITATGVTVRHRNRTVALDDVSLRLEPGSLTAVIGPSGAGKTTLLAALAGIRTLSEGAVSYDGERDVAGGIGYVPQDDILHGELPLRRTLRYAARLRMAAPAAVLDAAVEDAMRTLGLTERADVPVAALSGGQRKRANIACEILTRPGVCFLDEPTSGLDPAAAADLVECLRRMAAGGSTVVFTTHSVADIERSDRVVVLAPGGRLVATGAPADVLRTAGVTTFTDLYDRVMAGSIDPTSPRLGAVEQPGPARPVAPAVPAPHRAPRLSPRRTGVAVGRPHALRQWWTLTRRAADILTRNRLTVAILLGSPAAVIGMFAVLFRRGALDPGAADTASAVQVAYWLAFAGFFFGLTYGLLQICTEVPMLRRERYAGVRLVAYVASKVALLTPVLLLVNAAMLLVLRALDRIPAMSRGATVSLSVTMALNAVAALCLGLLASAAVTSVAQAALALPMLCFPAVLFSGAVVPLPVMAGTGRAIAAAMPCRWAFEAIGRHLHVAAIAGPASPYDGLGASAATSYWLLLSGFAAALVVGAWAVTRHRAGRG